MARPNPTAQAASPSAESPGRSSLARSGHSSSLQQPLLAALNVILIFSLCYFLRRILCKNGACTNSTSVLEAEAAAVAIVASPGTEPAKHAVLGPDAAHDVLSSLPTFVHPARVGADDGGHDKCTVCMAEFSEGETGRLFPACHHRFHAECISLWLTSHSSCPNCRSTI